MSARAFSCAFATRVTDSGNKKLHLRGRLNRAVRRQTTEDSIESRQTAGAEQEPRAGPTHCHDPSAEAIGVGVFSGSLRGVCRWQLRSLRPPGPPRGRGCPIPFPRRPLVCRSGQELRESSRRIRSWKISRVEHCGSDRQMETGRARHPLSCDA
jgi:hypothetical protein